MSTQVTWIETSFNGDGLDEMKRILASHATGQLVLNVTQGKVATVVWREKLVDRLSTEHATKKELDTMTAP